jgi:hypothetical protein
MFDLKSILPTFTHSLRHRQAPKPAYSYPCGTRTSTQENGVANSTSTKQLLSHGLISSAYKNRQRIEKPSGKYFQNFRSSTPEYLAAKKSAVWISSREPGWLGRTQLKNWVGIFKNCEESPYHFKILVLYRHEVHNLHLYLFGWVRYQCLDWFDWYEMEVSVTRLTRDRILNCILNRWEVYTPNM